MFALIPASFSWQFTDSLTSSYTVLKTVCSRYTVYLRRPWSSFLSFKALIWMRAKSLKNYYEGTVCFIEYQYSLTLHKIYVGKSLFQYVDLCQIMNTSNLIPHCNIFFPRKKKMYSYIKVRPSQTMHSQFWCLNSAPCFQVFDILKAHIINKYITMWNTKFYLNFRIPAFTGHFWLKAGFVKSFLPSRTPENRRSWISDNVLMTICKCK